ncbi:hypothetical protein [Mucilaginibacter gilvus]|uniref:Uncharacterized protein n=1 Tax=Mucilaginibacter gilvus TaxID=2305909 RepID=A0A3S3UTM2_9SPHI|nr:hypothetical protein [Mucilaginibacter gilvus]RWY47885.1 hypothetical protein EPL05_20035 [Mucilaginibacter gilvus]
MNKPIFDNRTYIIPIISTNMLTNDFQKLLICFFALVMTGLITYGFYCNHKSKSFAGTGRVAEIEAWYVKSVISWIATFALSLVAIVNYI